MLSSVFIHLKECALSRLQPVESATSSLQPTRRDFVLRLMACACLLATPCFAQHDAPVEALSEAEIDRLREVAPYPPQRLLLFISFLDQRTRAIEKLGTGPRHPGREEDIRDLMNQFASISDDLDDNLDDYSRRHLDVRKVLPRLISATERWGTTLRTPVDDERYSVARTLALTSLADVKDSAEKMMVEQKQYFLAHPPQKDNLGAL